MSREHFPLRVIIPTSFSVAIASPPPFLHLFLFINAASLLMLDLLRLLQALFHLSFSLLLLPKYIGRENFKLSPFLLPSLG
jgi:hypothetical protein